MDLEDNKPVILIVDDVASNVQVLANCLYSKYQVKVATNGQKCLDIATQRPQPDLILLDIEMPEMSGYQVFDSLNKNSQTRSIPVIFITGKSDAQEEEKGLTMGAVDYITKPFRSAIVLARIKNQILIKQQQDQLRSLALHDQLTGLYNRHYLMDVSKAKLAKAVRHNTAMSVMMVDIDHFKKINDTYGHAHGDLTLQKFADLLTEMTREEDIVVRLGGEEFLVLLEHSDLASTENKAEAIRHQLEALDIDGIKITASFGVSQLKSGDDFDTLLKRADDAVYKAKDKGRNRVVVIS